MADKLCLCVSSLGGFFSGIVISFIYSWRMSLVMLAFSPVIIFSNVLFSKVLT